MYFSQLVMAECFEGLQVTNGDLRKRGGERTTGLMVFLAHDRVQKSTGMPVANLQPDAGDRAMLTTYYSSMLALGEVEEFNYNVNNLGEVSKERKMVGAKLGSNFLTTQVKQATEITGTKEYPRRPPNHPLLTLGHLIEQNNKWGAKKADNWADNVMIYINDRHCGDNTFPLIVFLLRNYNFERVDMPRSLLQEALNSMFTEELSEFLLNHASIPNNWGESGFFSDSPVELDFYKELARVGEDDELENEVAERELPEGMFDASLPKNMILYGPPGTGKTFRTIELALKMSGYWKNEYTDTRSEAIWVFKHLQDIGRIEYMTFHQSTAYEEFIEGISAEVVDGFVNYKIKEGIFKRIANKAGESTRNHVLIIDEINRANISKVFGELITLIEEDKRTGQANEVRVRLPYSQELFSVPPNLYLLGTMNTVDRSIALIDIALRRRFNFEEMMPLPELLGTVTLNGVEINLTLLLETINKRITVLLDRNHMLGHALLMNIRDVQGLVSAMKHKVLPLLQEYFYEQWDKIAAVLGDNLKTNKNLRLVEQDTSFDIEELFGRSEDIDEYEKVYRLNPRFGTDEDQDLKIIKSIYEL